MGFIESLIMNVFAFGFGAGILFSILIISILAIILIIKDSVKNKKSTRR